jgi:hypothetical protein
LLDSNLDLSNPPALQLDALSDNFFLESALAVSWLFHEEKLGLPFINELGLSLEFLVELSTVGSNELGSLLLEEFAEALFLII